MSTVPSFAQLKEIIKSIGITMSRQIAQLSHRIDNLPNEYPNPHALTIKQGKKRIHI